MNSQLERLEQLHKLTENMLAFCQQQDWEALAVAEHQRKKIYPYLVEAINAENTAEASLLEKIIKINQQIVVEVEKQKQNSQQALIHFHRSEKRRNQFLDNNH